MQNTNCPELTQASTQRGQCAPAGGQIGVGRLHGAVILRFTRMTRPTQLVALIIATTEVQLSAANWRDLLCLCGARKIEDAQGRGRSSSLPRNFQDPAVAGRENTQ